MSMINGDHPVDDGTDFVTPPIPDGLPIVYTIAEWPWVIALTKENSRAPATGWCWKYGDLDWERIWLC